MIYTIHLKPISGSAVSENGEDARFDALLAIPEGRANWALIFPPFWLAYHKLWWELLVYGMFVILSVALLVSPFGLAVLLLGGLPGIYLLLEGNQLRRQKADRNGYEFVDVVDASNVRMAHARFLENWKPTPASRQLSTSPKPSRGFSSKPRSPGFGMFPQEEH